MTINKYSEIKKEIEELIDGGQKLQKSLSKFDSEKENKEMYFFFQNYEIWYSKALSVVKQILPDRENDFKMLYKNDKRKNLSVENYTINDALSGLSSPMRFGPKTAVNKLNQQTLILSACLERFDSRVHDIHNLIEADIFDSEIESAKHLHKLGFLRAAGAICGVVIEKHFAEISSAHNISIKKKNPTIADYNDTFKDVVYDTIEWRRIQRLGDLRNLCDHNKDREPTTDEVLELISGTERTIKTIF